MELKLRLCDHLRCPTVARYTESTNIKVIYVLITECQVTLTHARDCFIEFRIQ